MNFDMKKIIQFILSTVLVIIILLLFSVGLEKLAEIITNVFKYIQHLYETRDIIQLGLIALFAGWTISRFRNKE